MPLSLCLDEGDSERLCLSPLVYTEPGADPVFLSPLISSPISISIGAPSGATVADFLLEDRFEKLIASFSKSCQQAGKNCQLVGNFPKKLAYQPASWQLDFHTPKSCQQAGKIVASQLAESLQSCQNLGQVASLLATFPESWQHLEKSASLLVTCWQFYKKIASKLATF